MQSASEGKEAGMAVVIGLDDAVLGEFCAQHSIWCANFNSDGQCVLAGLKADLLSAESPLKALGAKRFLMLPMSIASHCPLLEPMSADFRALLEQHLSDNFACEIIANATTQGYKSKADAIELLARQLTSPVLYKQSVRRVEESMDCFVEFGYGGVLKGLNKRLINKPTHTIGTVANLNAVLSELENNENFENSAK